MKGKCQYVGCKNDSAGRLEIGPLSWEACKLHLDTVNGYVDLDGNKVIGLVTRPAIHAMGKRFVCKKPIELK